MSFRMFMGLGLLAGGLLAGCGEIQGPSLEMNFPDGHIEIGEIEQVDPFASLGPERIVVTNRGSGSISVIDAKTGALEGTYALPAGPNPPEPMYPVYVSKTRRVLVGDRANNQVVEFDPTNFSVTRTAPAGAGVFHMWIERRDGTQLWVVNDIDKAARVLDPRTLTTITTVPMPADLIAQGGKPHDVVVDPAGRYAYVSMIGVSGTTDYVLQFDTTTFAETGRAEVGDDPHLALHQSDPSLYVPCQGASQVFVLDRTSMSVLETIPVPGAHGAGMAWDGKTFYTSNISGGGVQALWAIDMTKEETVGPPVDSPYPSPHNIALTRNGRRLFLTHSSATSDKVTFYDLDGRNPTPRHAGEVTVGVNPFGIVYIP